MSIDQPTMHGIRDILQGDLFRIRILHLNALENGVELLAAGFLPGFGVDEIPGDGIYRTLDRYRKSNGSFFIGGGGFRLLGNGGFGSQGAGRYGKDKAERQQKTDQFLHEIRLLK